jgi:sulfur-carrier protein adenylyltransferase/sulfurtransferase
VLFTTDDIGQNKAEAAKKRLEALNPEIQFSVFTGGVTKTNVLGLVEQFDIVVDGTDNFPTRYLLNDACFYCRKIYMYGAISRFEGQVSVFNAPDHTGKRGVNYRDMFPEPPAKGAVLSCAETGVLGVLPGIIGTMQATETIKIITGIGEPLNGFLWMFDALSAETRKIKLAKNPANPLNINRVFLLGIPDSYGLCGPVFQKNISIEELRQWQESGRKFQLIDVREPEEYAQGYIPSGILVPLDTLSSKLKSIPKDIPVAVYCQSGKRSQHAVQQLMDAGWENVWNVTGGYAAFMPV